MTHRRDLDGVRGLAVLSVVLFHAGVSGFDGGYVGVDVFFVLSGYLIAAAVGAGQATGRFGLGQFYARRARRILPALFVVAFAVVPFAWIVMLPGQFRQFGESLGTLPLMLQNFYFLSKLGYFGQEAEVQPLLHTWSLAVEAQFYLLAPPLLLAARRFGRGAAGVVIVLLAVASFGFSEWAITENAGRNFYFSGSRLWEFLAGALCAGLPRGGWPRLAGPACAAGLAAILLPVALYSERLPSPSGWTLIPVAGTMLLLHFGREGTLVDRLLGLRPLVWLGIISYSVYLWHQPLFALARLAQDSAPSPWLTAGLLAATLALGWATWAWVEQPFRVARVPAGVRRARAALLAGAGVLAFAFGVTASVTEGFRSLWIGSNGADRVALLNAIEDAERIDIAFGGACQLKAKALDAALRDRIDDCAARHGAGILLIGDSHAEDLFDMVAGPDRDPFVIAVADGGCRVASAREDGDGDGDDDGRAECHFRQIHDYLRDHGDRFEMVIYEQAGFYLFTSYDEPASRETFTSVPVDRAVPGLGIDAAATAAVAEYLASLDAFVPTIWLGPRLEHHVPLEMVVAGLCDGRAPVRPDTVQTFTRLEAALDAQAAAAGIDYLSQNDVVGYSFPRDYGTCGRLYWNDGDHLSDMGAQAFGARADLVDAIRRDSPDVPDDRAGS
ncbi:acyltransferase family protein [Frigidibacter sp. MR17.24]|uniref:acyltransferase family protein n=1 Tax=Frigidibacter sp. MR17.24 TaxID=3127345 RepID=UPI0030131E56